MRSFSLIVFFLFLTSGCAYVDQKVTLTYSQIKAAQGGHGTLFIAKPVDKLSNKRKGESLIIGDIVNGYGRQKTADLLTDDNVGDWLVSAYIAELNYAGYHVRTVHDFPSDFSKGIQITVNQLFVATDVPPYFSLRALDITGIKNITSLSFYIDVYRDSIKIGTVKVDAKGKIDAFGVTAKEKGLSIKKALESAMRESVPEIIKVLEQS